MNVEPTKPTKRAGASALPPEPTPLSELPLSLWLRGDEPYYEEFSLDADAVMAELNIRRSRLTQISGKELRVARKRVGRYIAPMYRLADIQAYKAWTRPTATHQKSGDAIKEATQILGAQTAELAQSHAELARASEKTLLSALINLAKQGEANHAALANIARGLQSELRTPEPAQRHAALLQRTDALANLLSQQTSEQQSQWAVVREVLTRVLANQQSLEARISQLTSTTESRLTQMFEALVGEIQGLKPTDPPVPKKILRPRAAPQKPVAATECSIRSRYKPRRRRAASLDGF
jgi:transcription termination factor NusB